MADAVSICNLALQRVGAKAISKLTEDTTAGRACNRVYAQARDSELRTHPWSFARERVTSPPTAPTPYLGPLRNMRSPQTAYASSRQTA